MNFLFQNNFGILCKGINYSMRIGLNSRTGSCSDNYKYPIAAGLVADTNIKVMNFFWLSVSLAWAGSFCRKTDTIPSRAIAEKEVEK